MAVILALAAFAFAAVPPVAALALDSFTIVPSSLGMGSISPAGTQVITSGSDSATFTLTPRDGYHVEDVQIDGSSIGPVSSYKFSGVTANHTIDVTFRYGNAINMPDPNLQAVVRAAVGKPTGVLCDCDVNRLVYLDARWCGIHNLEGIQYMKGLSSLELEGNQITDISPLVGLTQPQFTFLNLAHNQITDISPLASMPNLRSGFASTNVTYNNLDLTPGSSAMSVITLMGWHISYQPQNMLTITPSAGAHGSIAPATTQSLYYGTDSATFTITPNSGYRVADVLVDGTSVGAVTAYKFTHVTVNHTISVSFAEGGIVNIPDPNLRAAVRSALNKPTGDITDIDMRTLTSLWAQSAGIHDLTGLEYATNLHIVYLDYNQIVDVTPLSGLRSVSTLGLSYNLITDITPLAGTAAAPAMSTFTVSGNYLVLDAATMAVLNSVHGYASWTPQRKYVITVTAGAHGTVTSDNSADGIWPGDNSWPYAMTPDSGYHIADVVVDGVSVGPVSTYTFTHVTANHTISVTFTQDAQQ